MRPTKCQRNRLRLRLYHSLWLQDVHLTSALVGSVRSRRAPIPLQLPLPCHDRDTNLGEHTWTIFSALSSLYRAESLRHQLATPEAIIRMLRNAALNCGQCL